MKSWTSRISSLPFPILNISTRWTGSISIVLSVSTPSTTALYSWSYTCNDTNNHTPLWSMHERCFRHSLHHCYALNNIDQWKHQKWSNFLNFSAVFKGLTVLYNLTMLRCQHLRVFSIIQAGLVLFSLTAVSLKGKNNWLNGGTECRIMNWNFIFGCQNQKKHNSRRIIVTKWWEVWMRLTHIYRLLSAGL